MVTVMIRAQHVEPGKSVYYPLTCFKDSLRDIDWVDWGVCEYKHNFWIGQTGAVEGEDILRLSFFDIAERRDEEYPDWGDEEVYVRIDPKNGGGFDWRLLNKEEVAVIMDMYDYFPES